jgi:hypothetical protein
MDRVGGDQRALQIEHLQQRARRDDFAAARRHRFLADHQLRLCGEGGDHLKRARSGGAVEGAAQRLAVDRHHPAAVCAQRVEKAPEAGRQRPRIDQPQQPRKRVVARQAILKMQKLPEKLLPILGEVREFDATLAAADRRRQRVRQHFKKIVPRALPLRGSGTSRKIVISQLIGPSPPEPTQESISSQSATQFSQMRFP